MKTQRCRYLTLRIQYSDYEVSNLAAIDDLLCSLQPYLFGIPSDDLAVFCPGHYRVDGGIAEGQDGLRLLSDDQLPDGQDLHVRHVVAAAGQVRSVLLEAALF